MSGLALDAGPLEMAMGYIARGWSVFPCHSMDGGACSCRNPSCGSPAKHPRTKSGVKDASKDPSQVMKWWSMWPEANVAIATGKASGLVVLDIDPRHGGHEGMDRLQDLHGGAGGTLNVMTGGGGTHLYFKYEEGMGCSAGVLAPGVDVRGDGGYVIAPGSDHASGGSYRWEASCGFDEGVQPSVLPGKWRALLTQRVKEKVGTSNVPLSGALEEGSRNDRLTRLAGAMRHQGVDQEGIEQALLRENSNRCSPPLPDEEVLAVARSVARYQPAVEKAKERVAEATGLSREEAADLPDPPEDASFASVCRVLRTKELAIRVLPGWPLRFNRMSMKAEAGGIPLEDSDLGHIREKMQNTFKDHKSRVMRFGADDIYTAVGSISSESSYSPVEEYLSGLAWDGKERLESFAERFLGNSGPLEAVMFKRWAISAVARALRPGCKVDTVLVFFGDQGRKKSECFRALAGEWFCDTDISPSDKDAKLMLRRTWIQEWSEMEAQRKSESTAIKAFISSRVDVFRMPYGKLMGDHPRSSVFVGSTNHDDFLSDVTGNRRFWVLKVTGRVDLAAVAAERDQLWAEAVHLFRGGEQWWLTDEEEPELHAVNADFVRADSWDDSIAKYLRGASALDRFATAELLEEALNIEPGRQNRGDETRVGMVMKRLRWKRVRESGPDGTRPWVYHRPVVS